MKMEKEFSSMRQKKIRMVRRMMTMEGKAGDEPRPVVK